MKTAEVSRQREMDVLIRRILGASYERVIVSNLQINEYDLDDLNGQTRVEFDLTVSGREFPCRVNVTGDGVVSCMFQGLVGTLGIRFNSLKRISLDKFSTRVKSTTAAGGHAGIAADERIAVEIAITCDTKLTPIHFEHTSRSIARSAICVVIDAFEMFINAESAIIKLHDAIADYKRRNRNDLLQAASLEMAQLVQIMPYSDVIERHRSGSVVST